MGAMVNEHPSGRATETTRWWDDAVFYQVFVDRFSRADTDEPLGDPTLPEFCGGDLRGVIRRLDYLRSLGATALWLSPINCTAAYHGYHVTDYMDVEARFGGMAAFGELLEAARPDFRIILDWVPNHVHRTHPFFQEAEQSSKSRYRDWFYFDRQGRYLCFLDVSELPKLNLDHPAARQYMIECCLKWLDMGIDGFRLDHVLGPSIDFWRVFREAVKGRYPSAFLLGEAAFMGIRLKHLNTLKLPHRYRHYLRSLSSVKGESVASSVMQEYVDLLDGLLDFEFQRILKAEVAQAPGSPSPHRVQSLLDAHYERFPDGCVLPSFLDNHDMNRFLFEAGGSKARLMRAAEIQFQQKQPPVIYYGTEAGLGQSRAVLGDYGDLQARQMMPWDNQDLQLLKFYTDLIQRRKRRTI
jgi:glycosidase